MKKPLAFDKTVLETLGIHREVCENCRFFYREFGHGFGNCQKHAPIVIPTHCEHDFKDRISWPQVEEDDYCGDFKKAPKVEKEDLK